MAGSSDRNAQMSEGPDTSSGRGVCNYILVAVSAIIVVILFPFSMFCALKVLKEYERGIILRLGRVVSNKPKGPGLIFVFPCVDELRIVDIRTFFYDMKQQKILTQDSMTVTVDAVVYAKIINARQGALSGNIPLLTGRWTAAALCKIFANETLSGILSKREKITKTLKDTLYRSAYRRGVQIERVDLKNIRLPPEMQRAMAVEAETAREAKAKVIAANGEKKASRALKEAADVMTMSPAAIKLRYLQTLHTIAAENNRTIVFPLPASLISCLTRRQGQVSRTDEREQNIQRLNKTQDKTNRTQQKKRSS